MSREMQTPPSTDKDGNVGCKRQDGGRTTGGWLSGQVAAGHASPEHPASSSLREREELEANCGRGGGGTGRWRETGRHGGPPESRDEGVSRPRGAATRQMPEGGE